MTTSNRHRIQRQVVEVTIGGGVSAPAIQSRIADAYWNRTVGELEAVFDQVAGPDRLLRLERLEVDLGQIIGTDWEPEFRRRLVQELTQSLAQHKQTSEASRRAVPTSGALLEAWQFYLVHGRLPWWAQPPKSPWRDCIPPLLNEVSWAALRQTLAQAAARARFVDAMEDAVLESAVARWLNIPNTAPLLDTLTRAAGAPPTPARLGRRRFWLTLLDRACVASADLPSGPTILDEALEEYQRAVGADVPPPSRAATGPESQPQAPDAPGQQAPQPGSRQMARLQSARDKATPRRPAAPEASEPIYLTGAGTIILHPFLEELFRGRGLLEGRRFRDSDAQHRAVHLLGYLTTAQTEVAEYELLLPKALCGCPFEQPLAPVELEPADLEACDTLLRAVLKHWTAVRSASLEWLRQGFLLRDGKLERVDQGWRLTVERRAQDVLLARLPWGFGVVGMPWASEKIYTHWLE